MLRFTEDHEWLRLEDGVATVGLTQYAQEALGDIVYVELPAVGQTLEAGGEVAVVESVKAASEIYAPVSGEVIEVNAQLVGDPGLINRDPMGEGWLCRVRVGSAEEADRLMDEAAYKRYIGGLD